jgi:hypothetical protein
MVFSQHFMDPIGSLPCSQETTTGPDRKADEASAPPITTSSLSSVLILTSSLLQLPPYVFMAWWLSN